MAAWATILIVPILAVISFTRSLGARPCSPSGECTRLRAGYYDLIESEICLSLYRTGQCHPECLRSLRAMLTRTLWRSCAAECIWKREFVESTSSWMGLCRGWVREEGNEDEDDERKWQNDEDKKEKVQPRGFAYAWISNWRWWTGTRVVPVKWLFMGLTVVACLVLLRRSRIHKRLILWWGRRRRRKHDLDLDPGPLGYSTSSQLGAFKRGARRHLKALRRMAD